MATDTLSKESLRAAKFFEDKLEFELSPIGLKTLIQGGKPLQIIDLRTAELYEKSHVAGARHVLYEDLQNYVNQLDKEIPTVVYCYDILCKLAARAALVLAQNGLNAKELLGGFEEYEKRDLPVESGLQSVKELKTGGSCGSSCH